MVSKDCIKCKNNYPLNLNFFYKRKWGKNGFDSHCITCRKIQNKLDKIIFKKNNPDYQTNNNNNIH